MKIPKFESKVRAIASDAEEEDSQFSVFLSHECSEEEEDSEPCKKGENIPRTQLTDIKEDENDLKESTNSRFMMMGHPMMPPQMMSGMPGLIRPPAMFFGYPAFAPPGMLYGSGSIGLKNSLNMQNEAHRV